MSTSSSQDLPQDLERAIAAHRQGRVDEALGVYRAFTTSHPHLAEPWHMLGVVTLQGGDGERAEELFREALSRDPAHVNAHANLGAALYQRERFEAARVELRAALDLEPGHLGARYNLGNVLTRQGRYDEARVAFDRVLAQDPGHVKALTNVAVLCIEHRHYAQALAYLERARAIAPDDLLVLVNTAWAAEHGNQLDLARDANAQALALDPGHPAANLNAAELALRDGDADNALARADALLDRQLAPITQVRALFLRAKAHEALGDAEAAFAAFAEANRRELELLRAQGIDPRRYLKRLDDAHARLDAWPKIVPDTGAGDGAASPGRRAPVFFLGFPRSGTTLFEQMLASHPEVAATNEISPLIRALRGRDLTRPAWDLDAAEVEDLRQAFWREGEAIAGPLDGRLLVDTSPLNARLLDYAARLFPDAKAMMILRDPRDACLSCFMQHFAGTEELANFLTLEGTARVYDKVMGLWLRQKRTLPLATYEFHYERLVEDMPATVTGVLEFLDLPWSDDVLAYRARAEAGHIVTPSFRQVGETLHTRACGRWRRYATYLEPVARQLAPYVDAFGYAS